MFEPVCLCVHMPVSVPHSLRPCVPLGISGNPVQWSPESGVLSILQRERGVGCMLVHKLGLMERLGLSTWA